ncbi:hypothetical protein NQ314_020037 [Rhamnusium bicolor]|uniref:Uncharacterized protein n=1 Tax=Rhamnusium bicolor TaxID=1586634 RepID=A0AAV8WLT5_9CUCU|nr:hypothetical protein NQ314_020037 [Rhamnusium bicolor]
MLKYKKPETEVKSIEKNIVAETPRLLELLKNDSEPDPLTQLKHLLADPATAIPDPMLVPKDKFSLILTRPGIEIPKLLKERPELRLPEALSFPHIMQDPNMLVLNIHHLESILSSKAAQSMEQTECNKTNSERNSERTARRSDKSNTETTRESPNTLNRKKTNENASKSSLSTDITSGKAFNELANDIDAATQAAFSQMVWLPYLNHLETMSVGNNSEMMKMLSNSLQSFPFYPNQMNQMTDLSHIFGNNRFPSPVGFPLQPPINYSNSLELNMWQEAMLQANMLRNKSTFENLNAKHPFRDYLEKN